MNPDTLKALAAFERILLQARIDQLAELARIEWERT